MGSLECLHPLVLAGDDSSVPIPDTPCAFPCPLPFYTDREWNFLYELRMGLGVFSFVGSILLSSSLMLFLKHLHHQWMFALAVIPLSAATILLGRDSEHLCNSASSFETPGSMCLFQGYTYLFVGLWTVSWWFLQSYFVFDKVVVNSLRTHNVKPNVFSMAPEIYKQLAFAGGLPTIAVVAAISTESMKFDGGPLPWCSIVIPWVEWTFFYGPICVMVFFACCFIGALIHTVSARLLGGTSANPSGGASSAAFLRFFTFNKRSLVFITMGLVWFTFLLANKLDSETKKDEYEHSMAEFGACWILTEVGAPGLDCGDIPSLRPNFGLTIGLVFVVPGLGLFAMVVYGSNVLLYEKWMSFFENGFKVPIERALIFSRNSMKGDDLSSFNLSSGRESEQGEPRSSLGQVEIEMFNPGIASSPSVSSGANTKTASA